VTLQTQWKNPQGKSPDQVYLWAQDLIRQLRRGEANAGWSLSPSPTGGGASDTATLQAWLDSIAGTTGVLLPGLYLAQGLTVSALTTLLAWGAVIRKNANGAIISSLASGAEVYGLQLDGDGGTFTGIGIGITSGNDQKLYYCLVSDMESYCVDVDNDTGVRLTVGGGFYQCTTTTDPAFRFANSGTLETAGGRKLVDVDCGGGFLVDTAGSQNTRIMGCDTTGIVFGTNSAKTIIVGNRLPISADMTVDGSQHHIVGNIIGTNNVIIASTALNCVIGPNVHADGFGVVTDNNTSTSNLIVFPEMGPTIHVLKKTAVNMNSVADTAFTLKLPFGYTRYRVQAIMISHASTNLTSATAVQYALYTAAAAGGTAILTPTVSTVSATAENTANNIHILGPSITASFDDTTLFFRVTTAHGSAATADVTLQIQPLP